MPLLDRNGERPDPWTHADGAAIGNLSHALVAFESLPDALAQRTGDQAIGVVIPGSVKIDAIVPLLAEVSLISIAFPAFSDGRGFSLAKLVRGRGFSGTLRAAGPLIADQFAYALSCGFDEVEVPEALAGRQPVAQWQRALGAISLGYQRGYGDRRSILDRRRAARALAS